MNGNFLESLERILDELYGFWISLSECSSLLSCNIFLYFVCTLDFAKDKITVPVCFIFIKSYHDSCVPFTKSQVSRWNVRGQHQRHSGQHFKSLNRPFIFCRYMTSTAPPQPYRPICLWLAFTYAIWNSPIHNWPCWRTIAYNIYVRRWKR